MIIVRLSGGLGNQLFQYAAGRRLAVHHGVELLFDTFMLDAPGEGGYTHRPFALEPFHVQGRKATDEELRPFLQRHALRAKRVLDRLVPSQARHPWLSQRGFGLDERILHAPAHIYLEGTWQSERYFADAVPVLRNDLTFRAPPDHVNTELALRIGAVHSVSLHVRRGDYVSDPAIQAYHGSCSPDYYRAAVRHIVERHPEATLFVFSDDPAWARANLRLDAPMTVVDHNQGAQGFEDMRLMSHCKDHIIANSSFSWWGAWLNASPDKMVIAPKHWFADPSLDTRHLLPHSWITL